MDNDVIIEILKSKPMTFTLAEIEEMMFEELNKEPDEMDTDFIDLCANILSESSEESQPKKQKKVIKLNKALLTAAILVLLASVAVPVSARYSSSGVSDKIVEFYSDCFKVNLRNGRTSAERYSDKNDGLLKELKNKGVDNVILPSALLEDNFEKEIKVVEGEGFRKAIAKFRDRNSEINGKIMICKYNDNFDFAMEEEIVSAEYERIKQLSVNGLDILIFEKSNNVFIRYVDKNTKYEISLLNCNFEEAVEIANTLN